MTHEIILTKNGLEISPPHPTLTTKEFNSRYTNHSPDGISYIQISRIGENIFVWGVPGKFPKILGTLEELTNWARENLTINEPWTQPTTRPRKKVEELKIEDLDLSALLSNL